MSTWRDYGDHKCLSEDWLIDNLPGGWSYDCTLGGPDGEPGFIIYGPDGQPLFIPLDLLKSDRKES